MAVFAAAFPQYYQQHIAGSNYYQNNNYRIGGANSFSFNKVAVEIGVAPTADLVADGSNRTAAVGEKQRHSSHNSSRNRRAMNQANDLFGKQWAAYGIANSQQKMGTINRKKEMEKIVLEIQ